MAVDVCSEIVLAVSPRISFSHDLNQGEVEECRRLRSDALLLEPTIDFDFYNGRCFSSEISPADEIFADGKILPVKIKKIEFDPLPEKQTYQPELGSGNPRNPQTQPSSAPAAENAVNEDSKKKRLKEFLSCSLDAEDEEDDKQSPSSKPFWQFRRSSSLNCDANRSKSLIRSLHFLARSNSTGSAPNPKQPILSKTGSQRQQHSQRQSTSRSPLSSSDPLFSYSSASKRSPLKKNCGYNNGVRVNPILNFPPTYISKGTVSLFGLGSLFCNGKSKKKTKKK